MKTLWILHPKWRDRYVCRQKSESVVLCCSLFGWMLGCCAAVVESGKRTGPCVLRAAAHLGSAELFIRGCHGNIRSQSDVCICGPAVCDSSESHVTPSSLFTPSTSSPHFHPPGFVSISWFCRQHFTATCIHSSILLILHHLLCCWCFFSFFLYCLSLSHWFPLLYPSRFFHSLLLGPLRFHSVPCSCCHAFLRIRFEYYFCCTLCIRCT